MCNNSHNYADNLDSRLEEYTAEIKHEIHGPASPTNAGLIT